MSDRYGCGTGSHDHWSHRTDGGPALSRDRSEERHEAWVSFAEARSLTYRGDRNTHPKGCLVRGQIASSEHAKPIPVEGGLVPWESAPFQDSAYLTGIAPSARSCKAALVESGVLSAALERFRSAFPWLPIKRRPCFAFENMVGPEDAQGDWPGGEVTRLLESFGRAATFSQDGNIVRLEWPEGEPSLETLQAAAAIVLAACEWQQSAVYR